MKTRVFLFVSILVILVAAGGQSQAQNVPLTPNLTKISASASKPIPKPLVYRYFLAWANDLDKKSVAAGESNPYKFAEPFQRAGLEPQDLDAVRKEGQALELDLQGQSKDLNAIVAEYRKNAQAAIETGAALPAPPKQIHEMQALRTAILVRHMVILQTA